MFKFSSQSFPTERHNSLYAFVTATCQFCSTLAVGGFNCFILLDESTLINFGFRILG